MPGPRVLLWLLAGGLLGCTVAPDLQPAPPGLAPVSPSPLAFPTTAEVGLYDFYVPEVVAMGKPFQVFADFDDPCGSDTQEAVVVALSASGDAANLSVVQARAPGRACPAWIHPGRAIGLVEPARTGFLRITGTSAPDRQVTKVVKVLDAGQPVPTWAPPGDLARGAAPEPSPTPTLVPSPACLHPIDPMVILQGRVFDQSGQPLRVPAEVTVVSLEPTVPYTAATTTAGDGDASRFVVNNVPEGIRVRVTVQAACGPRVVRELVSSNGTVASTGGCLAPTLNFGGPATEADLDAPAYYLWLPPAYSPPPMSGSPSPCPVPQWSVSPG